MVALCQSMNSHGLLTTQRGVEVIESMILSTNESWKCKSIEKWVILKERNILSICSGACWKFHFKKFVITSPTQIEKEHMPDVSFN